MFSSRKAVFDSVDIPTAWIFEYFLKLDVKLIGQSHNFKSIFNVHDSNPSMYLYVKNGKYRFKCFSTGLGGDGYDLIMILQGCNFRSAYEIVRDQYLQVVDKKVAFTDMIESKWSVINYKIRDHWTKDDANYWSEYNIGSKILSRFNVHPLSEFTMAKGDESFVKKNFRTYGYFTQSKELYKIYQPETEHRFINVKNCIQGWDQTSSDIDRLFICSSLKDVMSLYSLGISANIIAPQSETSNINTITDWVSFHKEKYTIFDNDPAGIKAMQSYEDWYSIPYLVLPLSKDISDSVKEYGAKKVKAVLLSMINQ